MEKYSDVKEFIDNYKEKIADDFDNIEDYYLILRIGQMYRELEQVKLSYEKLLNTEKGDIVKVMFQVRQSLYNARSGYPRKQELIGWCLKKILYISYQFLYHFLKQI